MSQFKEINSNVSDASVNAENFNYVNLIYNSEILKLTIYQNSNVLFDGYESDSPDKLIIRFSGLEKELNKKELTIYILSMLDNKLKRVRQEAIEFVNYYNKILIENKYYNEYN